MRCPICGGDVGVAKTENISDTIIVRYRRCIRPLCPFFDKTCEVLNVAGDRNLMDMLFDLIRDTAKNIGGRDVAERLAELARQLQKNS